MQAAVKARLGKDSLDGLTVAVQGVGHVGAHLCRLLHDAGVKLIIADVNHVNLNAVSADMPVDVVAPGEILYADADVLAPCALGNVLTAETIPGIKAKVIAGAANNQLSTLEDGARLSAREILYAPDYVINAGGIISVSHEYYGGSSEDKVRADVEKIPLRLQAIFAEANASVRPTNELADEFARRLIAAGKK
jgi:leucine dehydrogenase